MKKIILFLALIFASTLVFAQIQPINNPNIKATITKGQAIANKHNSPDAPASTIVLNFEGLTNNESIDHYYDGGPPAGGTNYGVYFSNDPNNSQALAIVATTSGGTGNFCNNPSGNTIMYFLTGNAAIMNVPAGFTTGFSFYYSTAQPMTINVYDGLEGSGNLLMTANYPAQNNVGCTCNTYCNWTPVGVSFAGTARSVAFVGAANYCGFDDVTFGSATPGNGGTIPTVSQWGLIILGFLFLAIGTIVILRWRGASA